MPIRPILHWPDPRLASVCSPVAPDEDVSGLITDMLDTMYAAPGRGLAAPQVGALKRLFVMDVGWKDGPKAPQVFINPVIDALSDGRATGPEGCLSIPGVTTDITRATHVILRWTTPDGTSETQEFSGFAAICVQHECDHLEGIVTFDRLTPEARTRALASYQ